MSQNNGNFQSKSKKSAGKPKSGGRDSGARGGFKGNKGKFNRDDRSGGGEKSFKSNDRKPREDRNFKPREDRDRKPRREGDFKSYDRKPREDRDDGFKKSYDRKPRRDDDRDFKPREKREFKSRDDRGFKPREDRNFKPREDRDEGFKKSYDRKPRRDDDRDFKPRDKAPAGRKDINKERDDRRRKDRKDRDNQKTFLRPAREDYKRQEASDETKEFLKARRASYGAPSPAFLYGIHPVTAALLNPKRKINRLLVTDKGFENIKEAYDTAINQGLKRPEPIIVEKEDLSRLVARDAVHQDVVLDTEPEEEVFLDDILNASDDNTKILILDQVTDPHNVGAILRSASAFGASAVVVQKLHAPDVTGVLAKSASGAVEYVPIVREVNLSRAMEQMKEAGFFCIGLDERGARSIADTAPKNTKIALVLGAEGDGLRRLVAENCDALAKLPTSGPIASLNVSNAAAVALYELVREND